MTNKNRPEAPKYLDKIAKEAWKSVCDDLEAQGTICKTDRKLIALYAETFSFFRRVSTQLANEELNLTCENGRKFINPLAGQYTVLVGRLNKLLSDLGLSPRTRGQSTEGDDWDGLLD